MCAVCVVVTSCVSAIMGGMMRGGVDARVSSTSCASCAVRVCGCGCVVLGLGVLVRMQSVLDLINNRRHDEKSVVVVVF